LTADFELEFDPGIDLDPYTLFHRLQEGTVPRLLALTSTTPSLPGAVPWSPGDPLPEAAELILIDQDGTAARPLALRLREEGHTHVRALFGGVEFYDYCLDPRVVGEERFLEGD
jgi:hypothetical protein